MTQVVDSLTVTPSVESARRDAAHDLRLLSEAGRTEIRSATLLLDAVMKQTARYPKFRLTKVGLILGESAAADLASLEFCFTLLLKQLPMGLVRVEIERPPGAEIRIAYVDLDDDANPA